MHTFQVRMTVPTEVWALVNVEATSEADAIKKAFEMNKRGEIAFEYAGYDSNEAQVDFCHAIALEVKKVQVERKGTYQGVPQWGITGDNENTTPDRKTAQRWAEAENSARQKQDDQ